MFNRNAKAKLGLFVLLSVVSSCVAAAEKLYPYYESVKLIGIVKEGVGYDANDKREEYYYLSLSAPVSVAPDATDNPEGAQGVRKIQLAPLSGIRLNSFLQKNRDHRQTVL